MRSAFSGNEPAGVGGCSPFLLIVRADTAASTADRGANANARQLFVFRGNAAPASYSLPLISMNASRYLLLMISLAGSLSPYSHFLHNLKSGFSLRVKRE